MTREEMERLAEENLRMQERFARLLRLNAPPFSAAEVRAFARDCGLEEHAAFRVLLAAAMGIEDDRRLTERYLVPALTPLKTGDYASDPYLRAVRFPEARLGSWRMTGKGYAPFQLFPAGSMQLTGDGREVPRIGYFTESFSYPAVLENGREWMTVTPNEIETMRAAVAEARGRVIAFGLGLGYFAFMAAQKKEVSAVAVVERDAQVISLFEKHLLPQLPSREKIAVIQADAFAYAAGPMKNAAYDFAFVDIWHDVSDGLVPYLRFRQMEESLPGVAFRYWIEDDLLLFLRGLMIEDFLHRPGGLGRFLPKDGALPGLKAMRELAPLVPPRETLPFD